MDGWGRAVDVLEQQQSSVGLKITLAVASLVFSRNETLWECPHAAAFVLWTPEQVWLMVTPC